MDRILQSSSSPQWALAAADDLDATLVDHAHCEKKAAASAISLINSYPEDVRLVRALTSLASEEIGHFREIYDLLTVRNVRLSRDSGDPYVKKLLEHVRQPPDKRKLDRLLICSLIEARSCERFHLLAAELERRGESEMFAIFQRLAASEAGHAGLFTRLAEQEFGEEARERLDELAAAEAKIVADLPILARIH